MSGLIDVHTHVTPQSLPASADPALAWPCMVCKGAHEATLMLGDKPFRALDDRSWDVERRCADMDRDQVSVQVLSPMPELLSYWFPASEAERIADHMNAAIAEMVARNPRRFRGLGMAPLQDAKRAAAYLERLRERFGLDGVEIGSNIHGKLPGDDAFAPAFEVIAAADLAVFVHALHPIATKGVGGSEMMGPLVGFPLDVAMAASSLILSGVMEKRPSLRIGFSHGGGALRSVLGRLDQGWRNFRQMRATMPALPSAYARQFFYDSNVYDSAMLANIARELAPGRIFVGTDYPYPIMQTDPARFVEQAGLTQAELAQISTEAALRFLGDLR